jgi:ABC-type branched-subunit amino acid transport system substrate-binding protein
MTQAFGDEQFERELRVVLHDRAEEIASRARSAAEMTAAIAPRLIPTSAARGRGALLRLAAIALVLLLLLIGAIIFGARPSPPPVNLVLAVDLPLQGEPAAPPTIDAVRLGIREAHLPAGVSLDLPPDGVFNDSVGGSATAEQGAANMRRIVADPRFAAVIGPWHSFVAQAAIPIANAAGLLECSATNTAPTLTVGDTAVSIRPRPDRPTYVRVATTDDAAASAAARLLVGVLEKRRLFVVTTLEPFAGGRSEGVVAAYEALGGAVVGRGFIGDGGDEPSGIASQVVADGADAVFFDGLAVDGGRVLAALSANGSRLPFVGLDIILDGPRSATRSFLNLAGAGVDNAYGIFQVGRDPTLAPQVEAAYQAAYNRAPESFVLNGYTCASVIADAIGRVDASRLTTPAEWREAIRAEVTAAGRTYRTPVGTIAFDANGDAVPQRVSIYRADAGAGDWAFWQLLELPSGG